MAQFLIGNFVMPTTAAAAKVTTGNVIKTLLQVKASATIAFRIKEWGISFDGFAAAQPGQVELIETDVAATVTTLAAADITKYDALALMGGDPTTNLIVVGTSATGHTATVEGSTAAVRHLAGPQLVAPTNQFIQQFPLGCEPIVQISKFMRIRVTFGTAVNAYGYVIIEV